MRRRTARAFTLIELMVAGIIISLVWGAVTVSLNQLALARSKSTLQLQAAMRADAALSAIRQDVISVIRSDDLFWSRLLITDAGEPTTVGWVERDEILLFNTRLRPVRFRAFMGDGMEFESGFRVADDDFGPVLWQRRDAVPDEYPEAGGIATPIVEGVVSLMFEAYDGNQWYDVWDSDVEGLPWAVRITVVASGHRIGEDPFDAPLVTLRTVVPIDRVTPPADQTEQLEDPETTPDDESGAGDIGGGAAGGAGGAGGGGAGGSGGAGGGGAGGRGGFGGRGGQGGGGGGAGDRGNTGNSVREDR